MPRPTLAIGDQADGSTPWGTNMRADMNQLEKIMAGDYTNQSGIVLADGDVVIRDNANSSSITTSTTEYQDIDVGVVLEAIGIAGSGQAMFSGYHPAVQVKAATARGNYLYVSDTAKQAQPNSLLFPGAFGRSLGTTAGAGTVPAILFGRTFKLNVGSRILIPRAFFVDNTTIAIVAGTLLTTLGHIGLVKIDESCVLDHFSYNIANAGSANCVLRFAFYTPDGQTKVLDFTDASGAATGRRNVNVTNTRFRAGWYYLLALLSSGTTSSGLSNWDDSAPGAFDNLRGSAAGGNDAVVDGTLVCVAGAAPATFDPSADITPAVDTTLYCKLILA